MEPFRLLIVTGMSGAGKTRALQSLEDMGYFCMDNLPPVLIPKFAELCLQGGKRVSHVAMVVDIRGGEFFDSLSEALQVLDGMQVSYEIVFIEANDKILVNRYKESRRSHPLAPNGRLTQGIQKEREILDDIKKKADYIIDTSLLKPAQLKDMLQFRFAQRSTHARMHVTVVSFGFKYGSPMDVDMIWDVRFLPNPFYVEEMRHKTGRVPEVAAYIKSFEVTQKFEEKYLDTMEFLVSQYEQEGRKQFVIGVACTGGMHRSVCMAETLGSFLRNKGYRVVVEHRDLSKNPVEEDCIPTEKVAEYLGGEDVCKD